MINPLVNFKNPYDIDGEIAKKILNQEQILGDKGKFLDVPKVEEKNTENSNCIFMINTNEDNFPQIYTVSKIADKYFSILGVPLKTSVFQKNWKYFDFDNVGNGEGICLFGTPNNIARFLFEKYYLKYNILNLRNEKSYPDMRDTVSNMPSNIKNNYRFAYITNVVYLNGDNPETSTGVGNCNLDLPIDETLREDTDEALTKKYDLPKKNINIVSVAIQEAKEFSEELKIKNGHSEAMAYFLVHGVGHNSFIYNTNRKDEDLLHLDWGVMTSGNDLKILSEKKSENQSNFFENILKPFNFKQENLSLFETIEGTYQDEANKNYKDAVTKRFKYQTRKENKY